MTAIDRLQLSNYRCLAEVNLALGPISVFFGPNGAGKSTLLDSVWFLRDLAARGLQQSARFRSLGRQLLFSERQQTSSEFLNLTVDYADIVYSVTILWDNGQLALNPEEHLDQMGDQPTSIFIRPGGHSTQPLEIYFDESGQFDTNRPRHLRPQEPDRLAMPLVAAQDGAPVQIRSFNEMLKTTRYFASRDIRIKQLQRQGSPTDGPISYLVDDCSNVWTVLRYLHDRQKLDSRFSTIESLMKRAFPRFAGIAFEQISPNEVTGLFIEIDRREPLRATATPDGYLQMLLLMTLLFSQPKGQSSLVLLDEPDLSLHPWALFVLADAIEDATKNWNRQVLLATHSPVLLSQFPEDSLYLMMPKDGSTTIRKLSEIEESRDLLAQYAAGSLYMSQLIGEQSTEPMAHVVETSEP